MIAIVDYGVGNLRSVERALMAVGATSKITSDFDDLRRADGLVLPGVGAFAPALAKLESNRLGRAVVELAKKGKPLFGVCLGYQLLFQESSENGRHEGLGLLAGKVDLVQGSAHLPVIGWCRTKLREWSPLFEGVDDSSFFYYVHSYTPDSPQHVIAETEHAPAAAAALANVMGTQFHPEKSGPAGLKLYSNFVNLCG